MTHQINIAQDKTYKKNSRIHRLNKIWNIETRWTEFRRRILEKVTEICKAGKLKKKKGRQRKKNVEKGYTCIKR